MSWFSSNLISTFLLPPLNLLLLLALAIGLLERQPKLAHLLFGCSFGLLWLFSTPYFADAALHALESNTAVLNNHAPKAEAIVILGGSSYFHPPEYANQDTVNDTTLVRLRYGARLYRKNHLPILVSGGKPLNSSLAEATEMKTVLEQDFQVPVRWTEEESKNTFENARYSFQLLQKFGIKKIYLVTHASHIVRASRAFRQAGFEVIEAPTAFTTRHQTDLLTFMPTSKALDNSRIFFHELMGLVWYWLKY
jgi:uncharacterized SAM-binding protein YcdF (DUF218 family)